MQRWSRAHPLCSGLAISPRTYCRFISSTDSASQARRPVASPTVRCVSEATNAAVDAALQDVLCSSRAPLPLKHVYHRLTNSHRLVQEFHHTKRSRRLHAQRVALRFLRRHNVLMHGLLFYAPSSGTWNHTAEFSRLALIGEAHVKCEIQARTLRLLGLAPVSTHLTVTRGAGSLESVCALFDELHMIDLVDSPLGIPHVAAQANSRRARRGAPVLTPAAKYHMFCAILAEMFWFAARTRGADRTTNNALFPPSDVLILNVLCTHLLETMPAELISSQLAAPITSISKRWVNMSMSLPSQLRHVPHTLKVHSLCAAPRSDPRTQEGSHQRDHAADQAVPIRRLTLTPELGQVRSVMHPRLNWKMVLAGPATVPTAHPQLSLSTQRTPNDQFHHALPMSKTRHEEIYAAVL